MSVAEGGHVGPSSDGTESSQLLAVYACLWAGVATSFDKMMLVEML